VVEHDDRLICAGCLARLTAPSEKPRRRLNITPLLRVSGAMVGLVIAWFIFFGIGRMLLSIPDSFHADRLWYRALGEALGEDGP
jgi:hypothetical protein